MKTKRGPIEDTGQDQDREAASAAIAAGMKTMRGIIEVTGQDREAVSAAIAVGMKMM